MQKFVYRKNTEIIGQLIEETLTTYIIESNNDQYTWEKELTTIEEIQPTYDLLPYETLIFDNNGNPMAFHRTTVNGKPHKKGKIAIWRNLN